MADSLLIKEIYKSIQGEGSLTGHLFTFIRLTGCNLRCSYCDSAYAFHGGTKMSVEAVLSRVQEHGVSRVLLTGGEPLLQKGSLPLVKALHEAGFEVAIETHGETSVESGVGDFVPFAKIIMDVKTPDSGMSKGGYVHNLEALTSKDEVKFVIASKEDYAWARDLVLSRKWKTEILFSPALPHPETPGTFEGVTPAWLAERIVEDSLPVRFQLQLHKTLWGNKTGV